MNKTYLEIDFPFLFRLLSNRSKACVTILVDYHSKWSDNHSERCVLSPAGQVHRYSSIHLLPAQIPSRETVPCQAHGDFNVPTFHKITNIITRTNCSDHSSLGKAACVLTTKINPNEHK